jgi:FkbM family methyltransferase
MFNKIYDIGANQGQNIDYFLAHSEKVIAVEPIHELSLQIEKNFKESVQSSKLKVLNFAVVTDENVTTVDFYLNSKKNWESSIIKNNQFEKRIVNTTTLNHLFNLYGYPDCLKVDIEGYDIELLKYMALNNISPDYLTIEVQNKKTLEYLLNNFKYENFNFVLGHRVSKDYKSINLKRHSSGPLGNDLKFKWVNKRMIKLYFFISKYGWVDIHCSKYEYDNKNKIGIFKTLFYLFFDKVFRKINPMIAKVVGKLKTYY